jgi:hypothetical protein
MRSVRRFGTLLLTAFFLSSSSPWPARAEDEAEYRDEMEDRLKSADSALLDLQAARFRAMFAEEKNDEEVERLQKEYRELQKERRELLRATGRMP